MTAEYTPRYYRIYRRVSTSMIVTVEDALDLGKVRFTLTRYHKGKGAAASVEHYMDTPKAALLAWDLLNTPSAANQRRGELALWWNGYTEYKGTHKGSDYTSRTLQLELATDSDNPWRITISNGPGEPVGTNGAIKPKAGADKETTRVTTVLPWTDVREMAVTMLICLQSWATMTYYTRRNAATWQPEPDGDTVTVDRRTGEILEP